MKVSLRVFLAFFVSGMFLYFELRLLKFVVITRKKIDYLCFLGVCDHSL